MAALGPKGLEEVACVSRQRCLEMVDALLQASDNLHLAYPNQAHFNEVPLRAVGGDAAVLRFKQALAEAGIAAVLPLSRWYQELDGVFTLACTERTRPEHIKTLAKVAADVFQMEVAL